MVCGSSSAAFISCVTLNKSFNPPVPQFPHPEQLSRSYLTEFYVTLDKASNRTAGMKKLFSILPHPFLPNLHFFSQNNLLVLALRGILF